jgi:signal transduction histidine kinase
MESDCQITSDRQMTETRLALLQLILDALPSSVYLVQGHDARLVLANRTARDVWGAYWQPGKTMSEFLTEHGIRIFGMNGYPLTLERLATLRAVRHGEIVHHHQEIIYYPDGRSLPVLVDAVPIDMRDQLQLSPLPGLVNDGWGKREPVAVTIYQDATILKEAERLKNEFISIAVHELRNPLAALRGFTQTLLTQTARGRGPELANWQKETLTEIDQATRRLDNLTEDLLDVARLQAGWLVLRRKRVDLTELTQRVMASFQAITKQHHFSIQMPTQRLIVDVDPGRIEQVLNNLIVNAIKYSPQGGAIEVAIHEEAEEHAACLSIRDHGIGIPKQQQARIFERFMRADNAQALGIKGTGLGLYLSRGLIEQHGGRIWFESVEGRGSTFFITLPIVSKAFLSRA